jgi:hypothetical protein
MTPPPVDFVLKSVYPPNGSGIKIPVLIQTSIKNIHVKSSQKGGDGAAEWRVLWRVYG